MAPRKRKDPEDNVPSGSGNPDFGSLAQGQGQVQFQGNDTSDGHPDLEENEQPFNDPDIERLSPDPNRQRDASDNGTQGNPAQHNRPSAIDIQDMTLEELELELEIKTLRKAILQKKKTIQQDSYTSRNRSFRHRIGSSRTTERTTSTRRTPAAS
ncbi:hypothetical protein A4X03_0g7188 [Tilletia caries]|uniref:Uncharacterized protein n=1 Tax=Tilletia caries TaxID=13290 RepID=A0A177U5U6_9BASI|nr:hypothetical protein A4X03_0g7188 [Tilletia caries]